MVIKGARPLSVSLAALIACGLTAQPALAKSKTARPPKAPAATPVNPNADEWNPNGSVNGIAGICSQARNVVGMMPHPERACESILRGGTDGLVILESVVKWVTESRQPERLALHTS